VSKVLALKWSDFDFDNLTLEVVRGVVHGRISDVKTEYSEDLLPLDAAFAGVMPAWQKRCPSSEGNWVFPNPNTGDPYHASPIGQDYIPAAGRKAKLGKISVGTRSAIPIGRFPDDAGAPVGVQPGEHNHEHLRQRTDEVKAECQHQSSCNGIAV